MRIRFFSSFLISKLNAISKRQSLEIKFHLISENSIDCDEKLLLLIVNLGFL